MRIQNSITDRRVPMASKARHDGPHQTACSAASRDVLQEKLEGLVGRAEQAIAAHPGVCFGAAVAAGVILGWLMKRK